MARRIGGRRVGARKRVGKPQPNLMIVHNPQTPDTDWRIVKRHNGRFHTITRHRSEGEARKMWRLLSGK